MLGYAVKITKDSQGYAVRFPAFPEAVTYVDRREDIMAQAVDCLEEALAARIADREDIPMPVLMSHSRKRVAPRTQVMAKALLWQAMRAGNVRMADLARSLGTDQKAVDRLLDCHHASRLDQIDSAFTALGKRLELAIRDVT